MKTWPYDTSNRVITSGVTNGGEKGGQMPPGSSVEGPFKEIGPFGFLNNFINFNIV